MQVNSQYNYEVGVGVNVHQDSVLSPLLFIPVMEALSHEFSIGVPWELLLTDDLLFITNTQEECISKLKAWKAGMESKELHVNMKKTRFLVSGVGHAVVKLYLASTPVLPALELSATTQSSAHSACRGSTRSAVASLSKQLVAASNYVCRRCKGEARPINGRTVDVGGTLLDVEATFCYLCDTLCSDAIAARCCVAWGKFRKLLSVLTTRYPWPRICGKVYEACVCPNN